MYITRNIQNIVTSALQAEGRRFEPVNSHKKIKNSSEMISEEFFIYDVI